MVEDQEGYYFMSGLHLFKRRVAYSNVGYDHIVGWRTSSIRRAVELPKWEDSVNEMYPHIVYEELYKACDAEFISVEVDSLDNIEGLNCALVVSLNTTTDVARNWVMPINRKYNLSLLLGTLRKELKLKHKYKKEVKGGNRVAVKKKETTLQKRRCLKDKEHSVSLLKIQAGLIRKAWKHPSADSLLVEKIDVGEPKFRQVVSGGLAKYCTPDQLTIRGKTRRCVES